MARGYKNKKIYYKKNYKKKYKKKYNKNKKYNVSISKLASKKIDSLLERRMVEISQQQKQTLINRKWLTDGIAGVRNSTPIFGRQGENFSSHPYTDITSTPYVNEYIDVIKASDINNPLNVQDPQNPDAAGVTRGMVTEIAHGFRSGNTVLIKGISLDMRIISDFGLERLHNADNNVALEIISRNYQITRGIIMLDYKVVLVTVSDTNAALPTGNEVAILALNYNDWGYSSLIDIQLKELQRTYKYKTLLSGRINCSPQVSFSKIGHDVAQGVPPNNQQDPTVNIIPYFRELKQYKKFNPPIRIDYNTTNQDGKDKTIQAIYFVAKSNYDASAANDPMQQSACPRIAVISKAYYYDN